MAVPRFHLSAPIAPDVVGTSLALPEDVAHHAVRVLRLTVGAPIRLFDGQGGEYRAAIDRIDRHGASARVDRFDPVDREWAGAPTLVLAIIATDAMDAAIRKAVELGVAGIVPVLAARSQGAPGGARAEKRLFHWRSIAIAACEQCGRNRVPPVAEPVAFDEWLRTAEAVQGPAVYRGTGRRRVPCRLRGARRGRGSSRWGRKAASRTRKRRRRRPAASCPCTWGRASCAPIRRRSRRWRRSRRSAATRR